MKTRAPAWQVINPGYQLKPMPVVFFMRRFSRVGITISLAGYKLCIVISCRSIWNIII